MGHFYQGVHLETIYVPQTRLENLKVFIFTPLPMHGIFWGGGLDKSFNSKMVKNTCCLTSFEGHILSPDVRPGNNGPYEHTNVLD